MNRELRIEVLCYDEAGRMVAVLELAMAAALDLTQLPKIVGCPVRTIRINQYDRWDDGRETSRMVCVVQNPGVQVIRT